MIMERKPGETYQDYKRRIVRERDLMVVGSNPQAADMIDFVKQAIAPYKYPRAIEFRDALPRTETGKLQRFRLKGEA